MEEDVGKGQKPVEEITIPKKPRMGKNKDQ
jgi:hypothetical protein